MANYGQVSYGSKGSDVTELQKRLNQNGYNLSVDGDFGPKTQAAVKDYQQKNGIAANGIVDANTWGALTKADGSSSSASTSAATTPDETAPAEPTAPTFQYQDSDAVTQANALLQQHLAQKPGEYQSSWSGQLQDTISKILNREKFSYDLNADALYQQYADQYTQKGKLASMDTMGKAAAMTGGYGNSYAQAAGQQAYQAYLQQLNDVVPELYGMARDQYNQEGQALYDQASLMAGMEDQEYGRYRDQLNDYYTELNRLTENARYMSETEYQRALNDFNIKYGAYRDTVSDQQWQAQFDEAKRQYDEQYAASKSKSTGSSNGTKYTGGSYTAPTGWDKAKIMRFQKDHNLTVDGVWGPQTADAYDKNKNWVDPNDNGGTGNEERNKIMMIQYSLGVTPTGVWDQASINASGYQNANDAYNAWNRGDIGKSVNDQRTAANKLKDRIIGLDAASQEKEIYAAYERGEIDSPTASELLAVLHLV